MKVQKIPVILYPSVWAQGIHVGAVENIRDANTNGRQKKKKNYDQKKLTQIPKIGVVSVYWMRECVSLHSMD